MPARHILLVDDQREVTRMLRTSLELLNRDYEIVEALSGEEAMLAVRRTPFDLLVTDYHLPGFDGLELANRVRKAKPDTHIIVITGQPDPQVLDEVKRLGAFAFFPKPLNTEEFLKAAQTALGEQVEVPEVLAPKAEAPAITDRLLVLRRDLGALAVFLADLNGHALISAGDVARLDLDPLLSHLAASFSASLKISSIIGGSLPANVQFFDGDDFDLYTINVGQSFLMVIAFDGARGATAMGPVLRYGRACADDLLNALAELGVHEARAEVAAKTAVAAAAARPEAAPVADAAFEQLFRQVVVTQDANAFWEAALADAEAQGAQSNALSFEEAQRMGLVPQELA